MLRSVDDGVTWAPVVARPGLGDVEFVDRTHGWAVGAGGVIHTSDGGDSWTVQVDDVAVSYNDVAFFSASEGAVAGTADPVLGGPMFGEPTILFTTNGGAQWNPATLDLSRPGAEQAGLRSVCFTGDGIGLAHGIGPSIGLVLRSADGGATWDSIPSPAADFACVEGRTVWGHNGLLSLFRSLDGGLTWEDRSEAIPPGLIGISAITFLDAATGWLALLDDALQPTLLRTTNGGTSWEAQALPRLESGLNRLAFASPTVGVLAGITPLTGIDSPPHSFVVAMNSAGSGWRLVDIGLAPTGIVADVVAVP